MKKSNFHKKFYNSIKFNQITKEHLLVKVPKNHNNNNKVTYSIKVRNTGNNLESLKVSSMVKKGFSSKGTGRGYGLYNIQKIINAHKGNLIVDIIDNNNIEIEVQIRP